MAANDEVSKPFEERSCTPFYAAIHVRVWLSVTSERQQHRRNEEASAQNTQQTERGVKPYGLHGHNLHGQEGCHCRDGGKPGEQHAPAG